jgi:hypothetical protein
MEKSTVLMEGWLDRQMVILDYLSIAQDLEQYGVTYFEVCQGVGSWIMGRLWDRSWLELRTTVARA